jgi:hypothetical protein
LNVSGHGSFNRLHTHEKSAFSGVLYIEDGRDHIARSYSGNLIIKPSSHKKEPTTYQLNPQELSRLNLQVLKSSVDDLNSTNENNDSLPFIFDTPVLINENITVNKEEICDYINITPKQGIMYIWPGWLMHGVYPMCIKESKQGDNTAQRISLAFNFNEEL